MYIEVVSAADLPEVDRDVEATTAKWVRNVQWENDGKPTDRVVNGFVSAEPGRDIGAILTRMTPSDRARIMAA